MYPSEFMDQLVYDLMAAYAADMLPSGLLYLELRMEGYGVLAIEEMRKYRLMRVRYLFFDGDGNPVPEPEVWFYIDPGGHWIPYEIQRHTAGHHLFANLDKEQGELRVTDPKEQATLALFADFWAEILRAQGWVEHANKSSNTPVVWPEDEPYRQPDRETLFDWLDEYNGCEATDSCWVPVDGVCEHGHRSWLLELRLL